MFKMAKYYMLLTLYRKAKKNILFIVSSILLMVMVSYVFSDLLSLGKESETLLAMKWIIYLLLLTVVGWNVRQVKSITLLPFNLEDEELVVDVKREQLLGKEVLLTKSERIVNKYKEQE